MKKDSFITHFIKGFIIGLGIIFPISASFLAVALGVYNRLLDDINNFKVAIKKDLVFLISTILGIGISCLVSCILINFTLRRYPIATLLLFCGLIIGGIPVLFKKTNKEYKPLNFIMTLVGILVLIGISFIGTGKSAVLTNDAIGFAKLFGAGALAAGTMMIPGVSGSAILVIIGYYEPMLGLISNIVHFNNLGSNMLMAIVFGIGMIIGIIIISKIMGYLLKKFEVKTYFAIIGFVSASVINIIISLFGYAFNLYELIVGLFLFAVGFIIAVKFLKE